MPTRRRGLSTGILALLLTTSVAAEDWPEWRGKGRLGVWNETGIADAFPRRGLEYAWRVPVGGKGSSSPVLWEHRLYLTRVEAEVEGDED